jgi:peptide/nickel transport system substrate-binding protein
VTNREDLDNAKGSPDVPADIRAFLIADIRGYTLFTLERGDEAAAKLATKFARLAREGVEARAGEVIELRGDEALCVFASSRQAIRAAVELQDRFVAETVSDPALPLAVGIGLDAGEAVSVEGGYRGGALNLAARLCGQAGPGEILASREVAHLARRVEGVTYADRGEVSLKGMTDPVTVIEVSSEAGPAAARLAPLIPKREPPSSPAASPPRRTRWRLLVAALALVVVAVAIPIVLSGGGDGLSSVAPNSIGVIDPESGNILRSIELPNAPGSMAAGEGAVWVTAPDAGRIMRIDAQTETVVDSTQVGSAPAGIAVGEGAVWVVDSDGPSLVRVSPETNEEVATIPVGNGPAGVAVTNGAVWVTNRLDGTVSRIDPATSEVSEIISVGQAPTGIAADDDGVWVANSDDGTVVRIDPATNTVDTVVGVGNQPGAVAVGPDGVWVANTLDGTVSRIDPGTGIVTRVITVGLGPSAIAVAGDAVWVTNEFDGTVSQVDIDTDSEAHSIATVSAPRGAATVGGAPWISVRGAVTSHRGGTLRVVTSGLGSVGGGDSIDPALAGAEWILINAYDGLVGFKRVGGQDGLTLVPNLAISLPTPADAGKTYRFKLREGLRYSSGVPVRASDFRLAFERGFRIEDSYLRQYGGLTIVGAAECTESPETCDLSEGIETDDAAGTITFHLNQPDPSLIYKLALPFTFAVPPGTPMTDVGTTPVPATGPYMIDEYMAGDRLVLVRNPEFHEWYAPARPDGYPDRIEVTLGLSIGEQVSEVEQGRADWVADSITGETIENLVTQYAGQVHPYPELTTAWLALNTSMPPFDDPRARRAVNYALDRSEVVDLLGGPQKATATCQFLPPNLPGFERYCPYTLEPNPAGQWSAPDLERAKALIDASGTAGDTVVFAPLPESPFPKRFERYFAGLFEKLGYRVEWLRSKDEEQFGAAVFSSPNRVQATTLGWISDYPTASDFFFGAPRCGSPYNPYAATFCDPKLEAAIGRAERAQSTDPQQAGGLWANADHMIVDLSPWVFLTNPIGLDFISARVGNYQYSPQWGILLDQLWVR